MNDTSPAVWIVCIMGALTPLILFSGASVAEWRRLARTYPDLPFTAEATFRLVSGRVGGTYVEAYNCFRVEVGAPGLRVSTWTFLRRLLPSFVIPWARMNSCTQARYYFSPLGVRIELAGWPQPIFLWTRLWRDEQFPRLIEALWREYTARSEASVRAEFSIASVSDKR